MARMDCWSEIAPLMGMDPRKLREGFALLEAAVEQGRIPGGVIAVGRNGHIAEFACGTAFVEEGTAIPAAPGTLYDCASLTKVTATLPLLLMLLEQGRIRLEDPLARHIPEFAAFSGRKAEITIGQLLSHTSGLPPTLDPLEPGSGSSRERIVAQALSVEPDIPPGRQVVYSDVGFILLGLLVEKLLGEPLDQAARRRVFEPLDMTDTGFVPPPEKLDRTAETEWYRGEPWPRRGTVHDETAAAMGGVGGHAGLFSTARDLIRYASMWLGGGALDGRRMLSPDTVALAIRSHTDNASGGHRGLGWVLKGDKLDASGDSLSPRCYGHTGFTGTSLYADPASGLAVVLLTNAVRLSRDRAPLFRLRAALHDAIAASIDGGS
ncbi:serine hydrolase domain-containing protein [Paenibacillaceae bacterium WGS1546]|uniref:serine hydrolase domain-containing protein n=1 Tax=Cohnella sp. WGS1546 TaxID=3366810 RepID=UPI00372D590A